MHSNSKRGKQQAAEWLTGGEMGQLIREMDWSQTPLGPVEDWPQSLKLAVRLMLNSRYPMFVWWGEELTILYNDGYAPIFGKKHPAALGQPARHVWSEIWADLDAQVNAVMREGQASWNEEGLLFMERNGFPEEVYFTWSYSPILDEAGKVAGLFCACTEETSRVLGRRRLKTLRDLGERSLMEAKTTEQACHATAATLAENPQDFPFALIYLLDENGQQTRLCETANLAAGTKASPATVVVDSSEDVWNFHRALETKQGQIVENLEEQFGRLPAGLWADDWTKRALVLPLAKAGVQELPAGFLVVGLSPRLAFSDDYRSFLELAAGQLATAIANARAYEEERKRAEALAELDRAKTAFFSNVSHEFRTPLTLMLGPLEDALAEAELPPAAHERLEVAHRNSLRLLKLVNTLLDFSRIEAGRIEAVYEPVDLAGFTAELASVFRSTVERAGIKLVVDCPPLPEPAYVDREMWEKIVLNLLSNAFKFTFEGEIEVKLRIADERETERKGEREGRSANNRQQTQIQNPKSVLLTVRDTGTGIPDAELPHLFERFHRVKGARGRSYEGSGIGLALVQELVKLHSGTVRVQSELDKGSTFTVSIPLGFAHLPAERLGGARTLAATVTGATAFVEEALRWLPEGRDEGGRMKEEIAPTPQPSNKNSSLTPHPSSLILLAEDNADLREYVRRLLAGQYEVVAVADGEAALAAVRERAPDLVLADVMMPRLDGFGLLRELRTDEWTRELPVILLSARAGEEARVEGLAAGADDYLVKPFSARDLSARVAAHLQLQRVRRAAQAELRYRSEQYQTLLNQAPLGVYLVDADFRIREMNPTALPAFGDIPDLIGRDFDEVIRILWTREYADEVVRIFRHTLETGEPYATPERTAYRIDREVSEYYEWRVDRILLPDGRYGVVCYFRDISAQVQARARVAESEARYRGIVNQSIGGIAETDATGRFTTVNDRYCEITGYAREELLNLRMQELTCPEDLPRNLELFEQLLAGGEPFEIEKRYVRKDGSHVWVHNSVSAIRDAGGSVQSLVAVSIDIAARKHAEAERERLLEAEQKAREEAENATRAKDEFISVVSHELRNPLNSILGYNRMLQQGPLDERTHRKYTDIIESNARRQMRLIEDLLDSARIISGKLKLEVKPCNFAHIVADALDSVRPAAEARQIVLVGDLGEGVGQMLGDPDRLQQVVWNLLTNAIKFTPEKGAVIARLESREERLRLTVTDTGKGVAPDLLPYIFDRFRQADASSRRRHGGLGLGLALAKQLVELHGGTIVAASQGEGKGTTFTVTLPLRIADCGLRLAETSTDSRAVLRDQSAIQFDALRRPQSAILQGLHVLLVDDETEAREVLHHLLAVNGAQVTAVGSGAAALALLAGAAVNTFDVVVSDIGMPEMDGYEFLRQVRARDIRLPAVAVTAFGRTEDRLRALLAGFQMHIPKPVEPEELITVINSLTKRH